jgi:hypothetical protein
LAVNSPTPPVDDTAVWLAPMGSRPNGADLSTQGLSHCAKGIVPRQPTPGQIRQFWLEAE